MEAFVIKRKDGKYFYPYPNEDEKDWNQHWAYFYRKKKDALFDIDILGLENCKPIKVRIEEV